MKQIRVDKNQWNERGDEEKTLPSIIFAEVIGSQWKEKNQSWIVVEKKIPIKVFGLSFNDLPVVDLNRPGYFSPNILFLKNNKANESQETTEQNQRILRV